MSYLDFLIKVNDTKEDSWDDGKIKVEEFIVLEVLVAFFAAAGNGLVLVVFYHEKRLRKKANYYIISLACADFCVGIFGIPLAISLVKEY